MAQQPSLGPPQSDNGGPQPAGESPQSAAMATTPPDGAPIVTLSLLQHPLVQNVLPFVTSLALHAAVIIIILLTAKVIKDVVTEPPKEQIIIPDADMSMTNGPEGGIPHPGTGGDPTRDAAQDKFPDVPKDSKGLAEKKGSSLLPSLMGGGGSDGDTVASGVIGSGGAASKGGLVGNGTDGDGSGALAPFGVPGGGGGIGPKSNFLGSRGNAKKIVFVCDASASMLSVFEDLCMELRRAMDKLIPTQSYDIIFFQDPGAAAVDNATLIPATAEGKQRGNEFLKKFSPTGGTNPLPSLELAFRLKPELLYILTDGDFDNPATRINYNEDVIRLCQQRNADKKIKINTIAFIPGLNGAKDPPPDKAKAVRVLQQIAKDSGGNFRVVSNSDFGQR